MLEEIVRYGLAGRKLMLEMDQSPCKFLDLDAEVAASVLARSAFRSYGVSFKGQFPEHGPARDVVQAAGLPKNMGVLLAEPPGFLCYPLRYGSRTRDRGFRSSDAEHAAQDVVEYIDLCLVKYGAQLSQDGADYLAAIVTEVLKNAEEHSDVPHWWIAGYLHSSQGNAPGDCHLTLLNFGRSISESLKTLPLESKQRRGIEDVLRTQRSKDRNWDPDLAWTVMAMQQRVSRRNTGREAVGNQGQGLPNLIEFFERIGQAGGANRSKMCVVSGHAYLLFDGTYPIKPAGTNGQLRIAFNKANDLRQPADKRYVRRLARSFPGTLVSLRFHLDEDYLNELADHGSRLH